MMEVECNNCGKKINKKPTEIKNSKSGKVYCSRSCSATVNNKIKVKKGCTDEIAIKVKEAVSSSKSMTEASKKLNMSFGKLKRIAELLGVFRPNRGLVGVTKKTKKPRAYPIEEIIIHGQHPNFSTTHLRKRLIKEKIFKDECNKCGWNKKRNKSDKYSACELHHKDGNKKNHHKSNLEMLCPNCHALTKNFRNVKR